MTHQLFQEFDIQNFDQIQAKLQPWIKKRYRWTFKFWNHVDQQQLFQDIPELKTAIENIIGSAPMKTYMLAVPWMPEFLTHRKLGSHTLHKDTAQEAVRLNWPVLNGSSIETKFFRSNAEPNRTFLSSGESYLKYHERDCDQIGSFRLIKPSLIHVHTIHGLYRATGPLPRYILSFKFPSSIEHLLNPI
jgi:hypothetical protein